MKRNLLLILLCLIGFSGFAQDLEVKGVVTNKLDGSPIPGVSIIVKNTSKGTITDFDGNYTLSAQSGDILVFSFIGFKAQEIEAKDATINVELAEDLADIDEVLVIGYGVQKKSVVTASISSIKAKDISKVSTGRVEAALQGRTAGVTVLPTSGAPGASSKIRIRGVGSNGNSNPLFIVDGMKTNDISDINPNDIQSTEILKDAASAAIYGTEGANGVVLITTKAGKKGKAVVSYDFQYGIQKLSTGIDLMNAEQYEQFQTEAALYAYEKKKLEDPTATLEPHVRAADEKGDTDWLDQIAENAPMQRHSLSVSGGGEKSSYLVSGSYLQQDGAIGGSNARFERYTFRINTKSDVKDWLEVGNNFNFSHSKRNLLPEDDEYRSIVNSALLMDPYTPVIESNMDRVKEQQDAGNTIMQNASGDYYGLSRRAVGEMANPVAFIENTHNEETVDKMIASFYGTLKPIKNLSVTSRIGLELNYTMRHSWEPKYWFSTERSNSSNSFTDNIDKYYKTLWENFASYNIESGSHQLTLLGGTSYENYSHPDYEMTSAMIKEADRFAYHTYRDSEAGPSKVYGDFEETSKISYFGRASYNYDERYMIEASLRRDGASSLPEDNKWGTFKALSAGWVLSEEDFLQDNDLISYLKFRASWGENGSIFNIIPNSDRVLYTKVQDGQPIGFVTPDGTILTGTRVKRKENKDLTWEKSVQTDIGVDVRLMDDKLSFSADYYEKVTDGLIGEVQLPLSMGDYNSSSGNIGTVTNKGIELELGYRNQLDNGLKYSISANFSTLNNEVTEINGGGTRQEGAYVRGETLTYFEQGYPLWYYYGYKTNGIDPVTGEVIVVDTDGVEGITDADKTIIGDPHPDYIFGGSIGLEYKNWDFNMFCQGTAGSDIFMAWYRTDKPGTNKPEYFFTDRWTPNNTNASMPKPDNTSDYVYRSDLSIGDGSYLRIKQLQLGYTFPQLVTNEIGLSYLRAFVSLDDYFTFTKYKGMDPEAGSTQDNSQGIDKGLYPTTKKVMFGLSVKF